MNYEDDFGFDELFFSRTDKKGIIQSGNSVFQRVSQYEWSEILGKPHCIVRHPQMSRGLFHYLWESILNDKMVGAYVVNLTKSGAPYWVFALVTPISSGFLSVRLKPSSKIFETVKIKYQDFLEAEKKLKLTPHESQKMILRAIEELGFSNYQDFMVESLMQELESRQKILNSPPHQALLYLKKILEYGSLLQTLSEGVSLNYQKNALIPLNLQVQAESIGKDAACLATISSQYNLIAQEIQQEIFHFVKSGKLIQDKVKDCQFYTCNYILQKEMYQFFELETKETPINKSQEMVILEELSWEQIEKTQSSITDIQKEFIHFKKVYENVKNLSIGLDMINFSGKMEAAKLSQTSIELSGLLNDLSEFKIFLKTSLKNIDEIGNQLWGVTMKMKESLKLA